MRDYGKVSPLFWTRGTGKELRGHPEAQIVALYLMSAPSSNMIGLYYFPMSTIAHDTGLSLEGASEGLRRAFEGGMCTYDEVSEMVFVHSMAPRQLGLDDGEVIKPKDNRAKAIVKLMKECGSAALLDAFYNLYRDRLCLPDPWWEAPSKGLRRGFEGGKATNTDGSKTPSKPGSGSGSGSGTGSFCSERSADAAHSEPSPADDPQCGEGADDTDGHADDSTQCDDEGGPESCRRLKAQSKPKTDLDPSSLSEREKAAYNALVEDLSIAAIVGKPAQLAKDLCAAAPGVNVPMQVARAGGWLRANPTKAKKNGARFILNWCQREQDRGNTLPLERRARGAYPVQGGNGGMQYLDDLRAGKHGDPSNTEIRCVDDF